MKKTQSKIATPDRVQDEKIKINHGFTLIELLIVVALIGILAVALLSAINPIEQANKANDTAKKSDAAEFVNAVERYYATFGCYPWAMSSQGTCLPSYTAPEALQLSEQANWFDELEAKNELKPQYRRRKTLSDIFVTENSTTGIVSAGFLPKSKTFRAQAKYADNKCQTTGQPGCNNCYICIPE